MKSSLPFLVLLLLRSTSICTAFSTQSCITTPTVVPYRRPSQHPSLRMTVELPPTPDKEQSRWKRFFRRQQEDASTSSQLPLRTIDNLSSYKEEVVLHSSSLVVVRFYAPWCKSCKASFPHFKALMNKYPTVKYVQVPLTKETAYLLEGLGVTSVPFVHVYHPEGGLVEERKMNQRVMGTLDKVLGWYVMGECPIGTEPESERSEAKRSDVTIDRI